MGGDTASSTPGSGPGTEAAAVCVRESPDSEHVEGRGVGEEGESGGGASRASSRVRGGGGSSGVARAAPPAAASAGGVESDGVLDALLGLTVADTASDAPLPNVFERSSKSSSSSSPTGNGGHDRQGSRDAGASTGGRCKGGAGLQPGRSENDGNSDCAGAIDAASPGDVLRQRPFEDASTVAAAEEEERRASDRSSGEAEGVAGRKSGAAAAVAGLGGGASGAGEADELEDWLDDMLADS